MDPDAERNHEHVTVVIDRHEDEHVVTQQPDHYSVRTPYPGCEARSRYMGPQSKCFLGSRSNLKRSRVFELFRDNKCDE